MLRTQLGEIENNSARKNKTPNTERKSGRSADSMEGLQLGGPLASSPPKSFVSKSPRSEPDIKDFVQHLHYACLHIYNLTHNETVAIANSPVFPPDDMYSPPIFYILHPRWCPSCLAQRTEVLKRALEERLANIPVPIREEVDGEQDWEGEGIDEQVRIKAERAYLQGVFAGRIEALSVSLEELREERELQSPPSPTTPSTPVLEGDSELIDMLVELRIGDRDERMDDLSERMAQVQVDFDEFDHDFAVAFLEFDEEVQGVRDGREVQGMLEDSAIEMEMGEDGGEARRTALQKALL